MTTYFQGTVTHPYHVSIGAVVLNEEGKVCCHYFKSLETKATGTLENFYLLMRETIEPHESIEDCLARGLQEEFGITASLETYIGSIVSKFEIKDTGVFVEKTTLYFLCRMVSIDESTRKEGDVEATSTIMWMDPEELIVCMKEQGKRLGREDADESKIVEAIPGL